MHAHTNNKENKCDSNGTDREQNKKNKINLFVNDYLKLLESIHINRLLFTLKSLQIIFIIYWIQSIPNSKTNFQWYVCRYVLWVFKAYKV